MFDFAWSEFALIGIVGLLFIGPKDMPVAIRTVTNLLKKGRKLAGEFQTHVDDMVREADLGEARDQLRQLRSFNVRGQIMKALDEDGSIKRTLEEKPFVAAGPQSPAVSLPAPIATDPAPPLLTARDVVVRPVHGAPMGTPATGASFSSWQAANAAPPAEEDAARVAADPAPQILPPRVASRLRTERARQPPPHFVPPRSVHPGAVPAARAELRGRTPPLRPDAGLS